MYVLRLVAVGVEHCPHGEVECCSFQLLGLVGEVDDDGAFVGHEVEADVRHRRGLLQLWSLVAVADGAAGGRGVELALCLVGCRGDGHHLVLLKHLVFKGIVGHEAALLARQSCALVAL